MTKTYIVKITTQAQGQMREIIHYIASELKTPDAALHLLNALENAIVSLSHFPHRASLTDEEPWHSNGIHRLPVKNFLIYFWIDEHNLKVQITAIVYEKRNQVSQLSKMDMNSPLL